MALLTYKSVVNYAEQQSKQTLRPLHQPNTKLDPPGAFEEFLSTYESSNSDVDAVTTDALEGLNIDEDGISDEYVMVDDDGNGNGNGSAQRRAQYGNPKKKYMHMLQRVADRQISEVTIELDDLQNV